MSETPRFRLQIAFLTGRSRRASCALSPVQAAFLRRLAEATGARAVSSNFPYTANGDPTWKSTPLLVASVCNGREFLAARGRGFAPRHRPAVQALLAQAHRTVFLAGSCGLELLRRLDLPAGDLARTSFVAYGPVTRARPDCAGVVVAGRRDWVARPWCGRPDIWLSCGHLEYLDQPELFEICVDFVQRAADVSTPAHAATL